MKNWNYIEGAKTGNSGAHLDSAGARQVRELAAKYWHSGIHDTRNLAMTVAWEWAKRSGVARETTQDLVSEIQDIIDRWLKEIKTGNAKIKYTDKRDSKKEYLIDEVSGDLEVWVDGRKVDSLKNAGEGWKKYVETHATKTGKVGNKEPFDEFVKKLAKEKPDLYQSLWSAGKTDALKAYYEKITGEKVGNASGIKEFNTEADLRRWCIEHQYTYTPTHGGYYRLEDDKPGRNRPDLAAHVKAGNKIGNDKTGVEGFFKKLAKDVDDREKKDDEDIEKVGNAMVGNTVVKTIKDFEIDVEKRPGENYWRWYVDHKDGDNLDSGFENSKEEAIRAAEQKINSGNFRSPVRNNKISNSASDDKFAYVMREFDEGKLKTPDGKVVTDPAQAKAIAYSESKKTENGLARARNAMNKKVKNSAVREYKHSDGRIAQIDFNEDGSDADMSIYEGTKEIEQKNFSTIRDAEQYVTSHGFRRI